MTLSHVAILPFLDGAGHRITTLADCAGMTKQGMGQHVTQLELLGLVERVPDPEDGRATLVRFTSAGEELLSVAVGITSAIEAEYEARIGQEKLRQLRELLAELVHRH